MSRDRKSQSGRSFLNVLAAIVLIAGGLFFYQRSTHSGMPASLRFGSLRSALFAALGLGPDKTKLLEGDDLLRRPVSPLPNRWFVPNQLASASWRSGPDGTAINGHIEESYRHFDFWSNLSTRFSGRRGGFGILASEVGHMSDASLLAFRQKGLPMTVAMPGWTKCYDGTSVALAELQGELIDGENFFGDEFGLRGEKLANRWDPARGGWLVSSEGHSYVPEEISIADRLPKLLPTYDAKANLVSDSCGQAANFNKGVDSLTGLISDYVEYARAVPETFPILTPRLSIRWSVSANEWESRDHDCIQKLDGDQAAFDRKASPCYLGSTILERVIASLCGDGHCPSTVYMDLDPVNAGSVDNTAYVLESLRRNKRVLDQYNLPMGLILTNPNTDPKKAIVEENDRLILVDRAVSGNLNDQESRLSIARFLKSKGFLTKTTPVRIQSRQASPVEVRDQISEDVPGSFANTVNHLLAEVLDPEAQVPAE